MLKSIGIDNFKAFSDLQKIELAPITLIYGANSSGKSSIIHSLILLKQSLLSPNLKGGLVSDKKYLDLGNYSSMVYGHELKSDIEFSLIVQNKNNSEYEFYTKYSHLNNIENLEYEGFSYLKSFKCIHKKGVNENNFRYKMINKVQNDINQSTKNFDLKFTFEEFFDKEDRENLKQYGAPELDEKEIELIKGCFSYTCDEDIPIPQKPYLQFEKYKILNEEIKNNKIHWFYMLSDNLDNNIRNSVNVFKEALKNITYLGPLRSNPRRYYSVDTDYELSVGKQGENIAYFINNNQQNIKLHINKWFTKFDIPYRFSTNRFDDGLSEPLIKIELEDKRTGVKVSPMDVGFGIGQILPILVEGVVRKKSTICVEQPEIHLHPKLQAELAEFFVATSDDNQWIIETHSEALMLRIQKLIRDKKEVNGRILKPNDVSIIYVLPTKNGSQIIKIGLDDEGDFTDIWPEGFFEERLNEF